MKITLGPTTIILTKQKSDKRPKNESHLLFTLMKLLNRKKYDLIKVYAGALGQHHLRSKTQAKGKEYVTIHNEKFPTDDAASLFWNQGQVVLELTKTITP